MPPIPQKTVIFFDIDGTLIDNDTQVIPQSAIDAVKQLRAKGHIPVVNTGRPFAQIDPRIRAMDFSAWICSCGMEILLESDVGVDIQVEETGTTFAENSYLKAEAVMKATAMPAIADDSGLVVDALNGAPGVYSARYGGGDQAGMDLVLRQMENVPEPERTARFVCVITLLRPDGTKLVATGSCEGRIATEKQGTGGFGYDPIFYVPEEGCTFAQMPADRKNEISHRAAALREFVTLLQKEETSHADQ